MNVSLNIANMFITCRGVEGNLVVGQVAMETVKDIAHKSDLEAELKNVTYSD